MPVNRELTLDLFIGNVMVTRLIQVVIAVWALALVNLHRKGSIEWIFVIAIVGGLLASPYLHLDDLVMLGLAAWLYLRMKQKPRWAWVFALGLVIAAEGLPLWGPLPLIAGELGVLLLVSLMPRSAPQAHSASI